MLTGSKVLGQVKNVFVVFCSVFVFRNAVSSTQFFGYTLTIISFFLYSKARQDAVQTLHS